MAVSFAAMEAVIRLCRCATHQSSETEYQMLGSGYLAQRLKRVFGIDIETCPACGGAVRIIA